MSYTVSITRNDIPKDVKSAWNYLNRISEKDFELEPSKDFIDLIGKLTDKYPCITTLPDEKIDDGVWSDGPLVGNAGNQLTTLGVVFSQVENVIPFIIKTANENGFVVFDGQTGIIHRPGETIFTEKKQKQSFWKRLFG